MWGHQALSLKLNEAGRHAQVWNRQALSLKLNEAGRPGPLAYPQPVWGRQALILKLKEAGRPARPTCLSSSCVGLPGAWSQAERGGHLVILNLSGAARHLSSS